MNEEQRVHKSFSFSISNDVFWILIWVIAAICFSVVVTYTASYYTKRNIIIKEMIEQGVDPIVVKCAIDDDYNKDPKCIILATKS